jgi:hypothetical protein
MNVQQKVKPTKFSLHNQFRNVPVSVRLLAINPKNLQSMLTHHVDKLTLELAHTMKELITIISVNGHQ